MISNPFQLVLYDPSSRLWLSEKNWCPVLLSKKLEGHILIITKTKLNAWKKKMVTYYILHFQNLPGDFSFCSLYILLNTCLLHDMWSWHILGYCVTLVFYLLCCLKVLVLALGLSDKVFLVKLGISSAFRFVYNVYAFSICSYQFHDPVTQILWFGFRLQMLTSFDIFNRPLCLHILLTEKICSTGLG